MAKMKKVAREVKELGRQMASNPSSRRRYPVYANKQAPYLPKIPKKLIATDCYIEGTVAMGQAEGRGQYRVVCYVSKGCIAAEHNSQKVLKKYYTPNHYGTGSDARKKPVWYPFR